jgi:cbb3-type cytochrome c oxidase subunit III
MKKLLLGCSIAIVFLLGIEAIKHGVFREYKWHQWKYRKLLKEMAVTEDEKQAADNYGLQLRQLVLPELGNTDRCISCHAAIEDPRIENGKKPLVSHPHNLLVTHDIRKIGCTVCHDGQGLATNRKEAHANEIHFWEKIRLQGDLVQANCLRCHHVESLPEQQTLQLGHKLFVENGCRGCHKIGDSGGFLGPDLTLIGDASFHLKAPVAHNRKEVIGKFNHNINLAYLFESVKEPSVDAEDSKMIDNHFSDEEAFALAVYLKSFQTKTVPDSLQDFDKNIPVASGRDIYLAHCSACHGSEGQGAPLVETDKLGPSLANEAFQSIATPEFIKAMVTDPGSSIMPAWGKSGGLSEEEIDKVVSYVLSLREVPEEKDGDAEYAGNPKLGKIRFASRCAGCHGIDGNYEMDLVGPTLTSPEFKTYATPHFLETTIRKGRAGTAMPAWYFLQNKEVKDIVSFLSGRREQAPELDECLAVAAQPQAAEHGQHLYMKRCAACHGFEAEGRIGPSLNTPELQVMSSDAFLHHTITSGREGTAMGGWAHLSAKEVGTIMAYLRSFKKGTVRTPAHTAVGSESRGEITFKSVCAQCHGPKGVGHIGPAIGGKEFLESVDDQFLREMISHGRSGTAMRSNLKGTSGFAGLSEQQIDEVIAYLRKLETRPFTTIGRTVTAGDIETGRDLFARQCAQCHGQAGSGGDGPGIGRPGFLATVSDGFLEGTIANGRTGTEMRGFSPGQHALADLAEEEVRAIVAYLRSGVDTDKLVPREVIGTPEHGVLLYKQQCAQCHGDKDGESFAPWLANPKYLAAADDPYLQATMSMGHGSNMRSMIRGGGGVVEMTGQEINDIIAYLRSDLK